MIPNQTEDPRLTTPRQEHKLQDPRDTCPESLESVARAELNSTAGRMLTLEGAARAAFDARAARTLTDADWAVVKDRLLEFFHILRGWDRKARTVSRDLLMFEVPCLPEL